LPKILINMPKLYSHFKYQDVTNLGLTLKQSAFIKNIAPIAPSDFLKLTLELNTIRILNTEKARLLNERKNKPIDIIYGCVTTGYQWQFLKLESKIVQQDTPIYSLIELNAILGILQFMVEN
jgi:hypothetical protein